MTTLVLAALPNPVEVVTDGAGAVGGYLADKAADTFLEPVGHAIARGLAGAAKKVGEEVMNFLTNSAAVNFREGWWANDRAQSLVREIGQLALVLTLLFLLLAVVQGLFAGDVAAMVRAVMLEVPVSIAATVALVAVTELLLGLVDGASSMVMAGAPEALGHFFAGFGSVAAIESGGFLSLMMVGVFILGSILVWIELVVRSSLIYLLMVAAPLTLAARVWPAARGSWRRLAELGVALIISKFAIALTLGLGAAALGGAGPKEGDLGTKAGLDLASLLTGASLMLLAGFTPFIVLKLLPIVEAAVIAQGISRMPVRAAQTGMQAGYYAGGLSRMAGARAGAGRAPGTSPPGPTTPPGRPTPSGPTNPPGPTTSSGPSTTPGPPAPTPNPPRTSGPLGGLGGGGTVTIPVGVMGMATTEVPRTVTATAEAARPATGTPTVEKRR